MTDMMRGREGRCSCCRSKPGDVESARAIDRRAAGREIREQLDSITANDAEEQYRHALCEPGECSTAPPRGWR